MEDISIPDLLLEHQEFDDVDRIALSKVLQDPVFIKACNYVIRHAQPRFQFATNASVEERAALAAQLSGMTEVLRRLSLLAKPDIDYHDMAGWVHITGEKSNLETV